MTVDEINAVSKIDHWFLRRLERISDFSKKMQVGTTAFHRYTIYQVAPI